MPRKARNPGSGKPPHNGPAQGPGWGGEPSGMPATQKPLVAEFLPGNTAAVGRSQPDPLSVEWEQEQRRLARAKLAHIMQYSEYEGNAMVAADKLLDRIEGKPLAREVTTQVATLEDLVKASMRPADENS